MVTMHTRIAIAPEDPAGELLSSIFEDEKQTSLFKALSADAKEKVNFEKEEVKGEKQLVSVPQNDNASTTAIQKNNAEDEKSNKSQSRSTEASGKVEEYTMEEKNNDNAEANRSNDISKPVEVEEVEESTNLPLTEDNISSRVDDLCNLRDCAVLGVVQRVAMYASDGKNNAKGVVDAWRTANTKPLQQKAKIRCVKKCQDLWKQLEKQKKQVLCIRQENTHYMNNLSKQESGKDKMLSKNSIIEEEEYESKDLCDTGEIDTHHQRPVSRMEDFFTDIVTLETSYEEGEGEQTSESIMVADSKEAVNNTDKQEKSIGLGNGSEINDQREIDGPAVLIELKSPHGSPLTIETVCESSDGEDTIGSTDVLTDTEINALSMSDDICAVQRSTIDFALAIIDCDVVLVDIDLMQSLILVAETAIKGKVFKAPVPRSTQPLRRVASARTLTTKIAKRATRKMNAIQRAIAKVDQHRQRQRLISSR